MCILQRFLNCREKIFSIACGSVLLLFNYYITVRLRSCGVDALTIYVISVLATIRIYDTYETWQVAVYIELL